MASTKVTDKTVETAVEELAFMRGVAKGLMDLEEGKEMNLADVKRRLRLT